MNLRNFSSNKEEGKYGPKKFEFSKLILIFETVIVAILTIRVLNLIELSINNLFDGSFPYLTTMVSVAWAAYGTSVSFYYNKSKLENKINIINEDIRILDKKLPLAQYDVIVTNPPYMKENTGLKNEDNTKLISRHEIKCTLEDIANISSKLLKNHGEIYMVHRPDRLVDIMEIFRKYKLEIKEMRLVFPKEKEQANLILIKAVKNGKPFLKISKPLYVYKETGDYTDEILKIYNKI